MLITGRVCSYCSKPRWFQLSELKHVYIQKFKTLVYLFYGVTRQINLRCLKEVPVFNLSILSRVRPEIKSNTDQLKPRIYHIFHSMFYCVQVLYTAIKAASVYSGIYGSFGYDHIICNKGPLDGSKKNLTWNCWDTIGLLSLSR